MSAGAPLIHARGLVKQFGSLTAVDGIDFDVQRGEAFGFLGPNGAGKSSTMRMIGCVSPPTRRHAAHLDLDPVRDGPEIRGRLGVVPQADTLDNELTVRENLVIYGRYFGLSRERAAKADELLEFVQLSERADSKVEPLSGGMKRRLTIARSLVNDPEVLLLDEPTTGLDPQARHVVWDRLFRLEAARRDARPDDALHGRGRATLRPARDHGPRHDRPGGLAARADPTPLYARGRRASLRRGAAARRDRGVQRPGRTVEVLPDRVLLYTDDGDALVPAAHELLHPESVLVRRSTLEDVFLRLTGRTLID